MPLTVPELDDRDFDTLLQEAVARIRVHNPEWTNFNDSDPGITLLQLFAYLTDSLLYRANRIPERNRLKFLTLLGVPLEPASAAKGIVTFSNDRGPLKVLPLSESMVVQAGKVPFRTEDGVDVLPVEARLFYKRRLSDEESAEIETLYTSLYASYLSEGETPAFYETTELSAPESGAPLPQLDLVQDTLDGSLWVALLARSEEDVDSTRTTIGGKILSLGMLPGLTDAESILPAGGRNDTATQPPLLFQVPRGGSLPDAEAERVARYRTLDASASTDVLQSPGVVWITLPASDALVLWDNLEALEEGVGDFPPSLEDSDISGRVVTWLRVRLSAQALEQAREEEDDDEDSDSRVKATLSWVGINAARVTQRARVYAQVVGTGTGEPDQSVTLANTPVILDSVELYVGGERWQIIDDLGAAPPEVPVRGTRSDPGATSAATDASAARVFTLDRESGVIRFGNGLRGARPASGAAIQASYDYGGGRAGVLGQGAITRGTSLPAGVKVTNPVPTWGGDEAETVSDGEAHITSYLRHRDRLVTTQDFLDITWRTPGVDLGRVEIVPLYHPSLPDVPADGVVTVMVIPAYDPSTPLAPRPDRLFLETVCCYLEPRRLITTELHVLGPTYVPVVVSVGLEVVPGRDFVTVRTAVEDALRAYLSPLTGGSAATGWPLQKAIERLELWAIATRVDGVSQVGDVALGGETGDSTDRITLSGLELPELIGLSVSSGEALSLEELRGDDGEENPAGNEGKVIPIPVVPEEC